MIRRSGINAFEVIVVIVVVGVLVALLLPVYQGVGEASRESAREAAKVERFKDVTVQSWATTNEALPSTQDTSGQEQIVLADDAQAMAGGERRIIYESQFTLIVEDISATETEITKLVKDLNGYVAEASINRSEGEQLTGSWRVRIPVAKFAAFQDSIAKLGVVENRHQSTQDVTEQFVDLQAQITNKKKLEERIVKLLDDNAGALKDVIEVERELARVRGEIEQMEGRLRYLKNRTDLCTIAISARVEHNYTPPTAPELEKRVQTAWESSLEKLQTFGERTLVAAVYAGPWIAVAIILLVPTFWYISRRRRAN